MISIDFNKLFNRLDEMEENLMEKIDDLETKLNNLEVNVKEIKEDLIDIQVRLIVVIRQKNTNDYEGYLLEIDDFNRQYDYPIPASPIETQDERFHSYFSEHRLDYRICSSFNELVNYFTTNRNISEWVYYGTDMMAVWRRDPTNFDFYQTA